MERSRGVEVGGSWHGRGGEASEHVQGGVSGFKSGLGEGREVGIGSGAGRTGAERGEPCGIFELWRAVSCRSSDQQWWRTELDLSSGKSFDDLHGSATLGAAPKRARFLGGGFRFDLRWNCAQCYEA
jgi:hypothetical protein